MLTRIIPTGLTIETGFEGDDFIQCKTTIIIKFNHLFYKSKIDTRYKEFHEACNYQLLFRVSIYKHLKIFLSINGLLK